jgi:large subunit ribosomal protein L32e
MGFTSWTSKDGENMEEEEAIKQLTMIDGVGKAKAQILYDAGFQTIESIQKADEVEITDIKGIGEKLGKKIKESAEKMIVEEETLREMKPKIEASPVVISLDAETKRLLNVRKKQKSKKPTFKQTDSHKKKKLADHWRRPDGIHNKTRYGKHGKCPLVEAGYGSPAAVRGLHPSGFEEVIVNNVKDLGFINIEKQAARIGRTVGAKKRIDIENKAAELGLKILNPARMVD